MSKTAPSHQLNLRKPYLTLIADDIKTVEVRVGYPWMHKIQAGHELTFVSGDETVVTRVKRVTEYELLTANRKQRRRHPKKAKSYRTVIHEPGGTRARRSAI